MSAVFDLTRPYEPMGMTTALWEEIAPSLVAVADLVFGQETVRIATLIELSETRGGDDRYPFVVRHEGRLHVVDGHNRLTRQIVLGARRVWCRVKE